MKRIKDGLASGRHKAYYENGQLEQEGWFINDSAKDLWKFYYENGQLERFKV